MSGPGSTNPSGSWDRLSEIDVEGIDAALGVVFPDRETPTHQVGWRSRLAAAWADLVIIIAMTTALVGTVFLFGYPLSIQALPWAFVVALLGWCTGSVVVLRVRRGTPGMLVGGFVFGGELAGARLVWTVMAAGICAIFLGLPALPGARSTSFLSFASGSALTPAG